MATTKQETRLSDEQLAQAMELARGADSVELKLTVPETDQRSTVAALEMDPLDAQIRQRAATGSARHQFQASSSLPRSEGFCSRRRSDAFAHHRQGRGRRIEQHIPQGRGFRGGIPTVDVQCRIGFGDARLLHARQRRRKRLALFHGREDVVRGAVHNAAKTGDVHGWHGLTDESEDRDAVHDGAFEQKRDAGARGFVGECAVRKRDRAFVCGYVESRMAEGAKELAAYVQKHSNDPLGYYDLALLSWRERPQEALEALTQATRLDPRFAAARVNRAWLLNRMGRTAGYRADLID